MAKSEVGCLCSEDESQPEVGVASSKASNMMEVDETWRSRTMTS